MPLTPADTFSPDLDHDALDQMRNLCQDRGPAMRRLRSRYFSKATAASPEERWGLLRLTSALERLVWILRRLAETRRRILLVLEPTDADPSPPLARENARPESP